MYSLSIGDGTSWKQSMKMAARFFWRPKKVQAGFELTLLDMHMVVDMIHAVAVIAFAPRAIAELQVWIVGIGAAADRTFVMIGLLPGCIAVLIGPIGIGLLLLLRTGPFGTGTGNGSRAAVAEHVFDVGTEKQEIV